MTNLDGAKAEVMTQIRELARTIDFEPKVKNLTQHLITDFILLGLIYGLLSQEAIASYILAQLLLPIFFFRSFGLMHDCVHNSAIKNRFLNDFIGFFFGATSFLPYYAWKAVHLKHHLWAGNVEQDPVMKLVREYDPNKRTKFAIINFFWQSWVPLMALLQHVVFWVTGFEYFTEAKKKKQLIPFAMSYAIPAAVYWGLYKAGIFHFKNFVPGLVLYLALVEVINLPHHLRLKQYRGDHKIPVWLQFEISRSCLYPKWLARHILNNFNLHAEHHIFPKLPWYRLDQVQPVIQNIVGGDYNFCVKNEWIIANRQKPIGDVLVFSETPNPEERVA